MGLFPKSSYYDKNFRQSAALIRARRPYLVKNIAMGLGLWGFAISIYVYTINAVSQDEFEDVVVPDVPKKSSSPILTGATAFNEAKVGK